MTGIPQIERASLALVRQRLEQPKNLERNPTAFLWHTNKSPLKSWL